MLLAVLSLTSLAAPWAANDLEVEQRYHWLVPLGAEAFSVTPKGQNFYLVASAQSPEFEGWVRGHIGAQSLLLDAAGQPVRRYPQSLEFRITASRRLTLEGISPLPLSAPIAVDDMLSQLQFQLKAFHGLRYTSFEPASVELIGLPADIPSDERIYRIDFNIGDMPAERRLVLEVLMPDGQRLCKFHLDL